MKIARKCKGLPLAVVVVAGVLATIEHDVLVWEEFAESLTSTMVSGTDQCKKSLELSYEHLAYHLKSCLLYIAAFQEDEKISAKDLMRLWIAEGFVEKIEGKRSEVIAEEYLMDLIGRNLVMVSKWRSTGGVRTCYVHDSIFEFCQTEAKERNFLQVLQGFDELSTFNEIPDLPRFLICSKGEGFMKSRLFCPHLGSLIFFNEATAPFFQLLNFSFLFCIYKHLKVLKLERVNLRLKELPTEVESLLCLRYLALTAWELTFIPPSIAKLSNLETFCPNSDETVSLPDSIWNMKILRHVHVRKGPVVFRPSSNGNGAEDSSTLPNLVTLSNLCLSNLDTLRRIPNIRQLKICTEKEGIRVYSNMSRLECLESLTLDLGYLSSENLVYQLSFPMNLKRLFLFGLTLFSRRISQIEQLPSLEVLKLYSCPWFGMRWRWELMEGGFPNLRVL